jgi:hypothetical protein
MFRNPNPRRIRLTPGQQAQLERVYLTEFKRRTKAGDAPPFAAMMADVLQLQTLNKMVGNGH